MKTVSDKQFCKLVEGGWVLKRIHGRVMYVQNFRSPKLRMPCSHRLWVYGGSRARPDTVVAKIIAERTGARIDYLPNPRNDADLPAVPTAQAGENDLHVKNDRFLALGLEPITLGDGLMKEVTDIDRKYAPPLRSQEDSLRVAVAPNGQGLRSASANGGPAREGRHRLSEMSADLHLGPLADAFATDPYSPPDFGSQVRTQ